jgi:tungstate transport system substrate-binding protein
MEKKMFNKKSINKLAILIVIASMLLAACAPAATATSAPAAPQAQPTTAAPTEAPKAEPTTAPSTVATAAATKAPVPTRMPAGPTDLILATTTSTADSGLLDFILPDFEKQFGAKVKVIAVGTGQAIQLGKDGNADVLLVHARSQEDEFIKNNDGTRREDVMYNDFIIVGPDSDPAKIKGMKTAGEAFKALADAKAKFVSRGDKSGTDTKEKSIWKAISIDPKGDWYISAGQGMGAVLTMANEQNAYTFSDRATYLAQTKKGLQLKIMVEGGKDLLNPYGVIAVNPAKSPKINSDLATKFIDWIISVPTQTLISTYGVKDFGQQLFIPQSKPWMDSQKPQASATSGLKITGKVGETKTWAETDVKAMETMTTKAANKDGKEEDYTGVNVKKLVELAKPAADAATLTFIADDGYKADAPLKDVMACEKCIVSFRSNGGFSLIMPDFAKNLQVKGLVEINVK